MSALERLGLAALKALEPETAHVLALRALKLGLAGARGPITTSRLKTRIAGLEVPNPVGTAAGFDKNALAVDATLAAGFGFAEVGAVTPRPQSGNAKPRLFRLDADRAVINRFGFNNRGLSHVRAALADRRRSGIVGANLGANKDSEDRGSDYVDVLEGLYPVADFFTVNVSSPNTERLRELQGRAALETLLSRVIAARESVANATGHRKPLFLKVAPDLSNSEIRDIGQVCLAMKLDAIVATNTTLAREGLHSPHAREAGGLSGAPLFARSTEVLRQLYVETGGAIPLIGVGGISTPEQAYAKIRAGASAIQLYTAMVYEGVSLCSRITSGLDQLLERDGIDTVSSAVGRDA